LDLGVPSITRAAHELLGALEHEDARASPQKQTGYSCPAGSSQFAEERMGCFAGLIWGTLDVTQQGL
jgi:hypothetical protein